MSSIFYDTETTGTQVRFDQILQFAAIRADDDLNPIDTFEIRSRLQRHVLANPAAMNITGITVEKLHDPSLPSHYEMCQQIHERLTEWSPATMVGYNSIRFDEEILRSAFYQSRLPIYLTNTNGNCRRRFQDRSTVLLKFRHKKTSGVSRGELTLDIASTAHSVGHIPLLGKPPRTSRRLAERVSSSLDASMTLRIIGEDFKLGDNL